MGTWFTHNTASPGITDGDISCDVVLDEIRGHETHLQTHTKHAPCKQNEQTQSKHKTPINQQINVLI